MFSLATRINHSWHHILEVIPSNNGSLKFLSKKITNGNKVIWCMDTTEVNATSEIANENLIVKRNHKSQFLTYIYRKGLGVPLQNEKSCSHSQGCGFRNQKCLKLSSFQLKSKLRKSISGKKKTLATGWDSLTAFLCTSKFCWHCYISYFGSLIHSENVEQQWTDRVWLFTAVTYTGIWELEQWW